MIKKIFVKDESTFYDFEIILNVYELKKDPKFIVLDARKDEIEPFEAYFDFKYKKDSAKFLSFLKDITTSIRLVSHKSTISKKYKIIEEKKDDIVIGGTSMFSHKKYTFKECLLDE